MGQAACTFRTDWTRGLGMCTHVLDVIAQSRSKEKDERVERNWSRIGES